MRLNSIEEFKEFAAKSKNDFFTEKPVVRICMTGCRAHGAEQVLKAFEDEVEKQGIEDKVEIRATGCQGLCSGAPVMTIEPYNYFYQKVAPQDAAEIIKETVFGGKPIERFGYKNKGKVLVKQNDIPFFKDQVKIALRNCGIIDPLKIEHYLANKGYCALEKVIFEMTPQEVIEQVKTSGLRGRGGAGFPTGTKWEYAALSKSSQKYVICNADEGDPGAFMDRGILEGDPHSVIEGLAIAAYSIGASKGYVYVRAEYPIAVKHMQAAVEQARALGLLGKDILGSGFDFDIEIKQGAGAFVCGEETALMASIEGRRGMPHLRPPYPVESGLYGKPTVINNVETLANISQIILNGGNWYASFGTENSKGTKVFSLAGKINNTGLVEIPLGIEIKKLVFDIAGGIQNDGKFKAVQMGGPSGGCISKDMIDLPIDYDSLQKAGAIMGSGGMIVVDEDTCMVDFVKFFMGFLQDESCGKCVPCRVGTKRMLEILEKIAKRRAKIEDLEKLEELAGVVKETSLCGLGQTAPNPLTSTLKYFRTEYVAHIEEKKCPSGVCSARVNIQALKEKVKT